MTPSLAAQALVPTTVAALGMQPMPAPANGSGEVPDVATGLPVFLALFMALNDAEAPLEDGAMPSMEAPVAEQSDPLHRGPAPQGTSSTRPPSLPPVTVPAPQVPQAPLVAPEVVLYRTAVAAISQGLPAPMREAGIAEPATTKNGESRDSDSESDSGPNPSMTPAAVPLLAMLSPPTLPPVVERPSSAAMQAEPPTQSSRVLTWPVNSVLPPSGAVPMAGADLEAATPSTPIAPPSTLQPAAAMPPQSPPISAAPATAAVSAPAAVAPQVHPAAAALGVAAPDAQPIDTPLPVQTTDDGNVGALSFVPAPPDLVSSALPPVRDVKPAAAWHAPLIQALGERVHLQLARGSEHATIRLDPPSMGSVEIVLRHEAGVLQVQLSASHGDVQRQLLHIADALRQDLSQRQFSEVSVQVSAQSSGDGDGRSRQAPQRGHERESAPGRAWVDDLPGDAAGLPFSLQHSAD